MKKKIIITKSILFGASILLQGCVPKLPDAQVDSKNNITLPNKYPGYGNSNITSVSKDRFKKNSITASHSWTKFFGDPNLKKLIQTGLKNNQELKIINQEIHISNNEILSRRGEFLPKFMIGSQYEIEKVGRFTSQGANDETAEYEPGKFVPAVLHNHKAGAFMSWEIDIWSKLRNATRSAYLKYLASQEVKKLVSTQLVAEIANNYYELIALDQQLAIVRNFIGTLKQAQSMVEAQKNAGRSTSLAVKRFQAEVLKNQSRVFKIKQDIIIHENNLNQLLGRFPQPINRSHRGLTAYIPKNFNTNIPAKLLDNRPDIKQASLELIASRIDVKVAKARFFPSLSIDAGVGYEAFDAKHFLKSPDSIFYNIAGNLAAPIINRNAIKADYFSANNKQIQAIYNYELSILKAYKEVSNQLTTLSNIKKIYQLRRRQVSALYESVDISNMLFKAARVDYIEALMTRRDLLESEIELVEIKKKQLTTYVNLYKSLGGGWRK
jgi:NodT family efflux transporter outer membrane factor (OMF) lipoprotein